MDSEDVNMEKIATASVPLVLHQDEWINRRVEEFIFNDEGTVRHRMSIDFTVPSGLLEDLTINDGLGNKQLVVPLGFFHKDLDFQDLDVRDREDHAVSILSRQLLGQITQQAQCLACCMLGVEIKSNLSLLCVYLPSRQQHLVKLSYNKFITRPRKYAWFWTQLEWEDHRLTLLVPTANHAQEYHCEVVVPSDVEIKNMQPFNGKSKLYENPCDKIGPYRATIAPLEKPLPAKTRGIIKLDLRLAWSSFVGAARIVSLAITIVLIVNTVANVVDSQKLPTGEALAVIILAFIGIFAAQIARPGVHPFEQALGRNIRTLLILQIFIALIGIMEITFFDRSEPKVDKFDKAGERVVADIVWYAAVFFSIWFTFMIWGGAKVQSIKKLSHKIRVIIMFAISSVIIAALWALDQPVNYSMLFAGISTVILVLVIIALILGLSKIESIRYPNLFKSSKKNDAGGLYVGSEEEYMNRQSGEMHETCKTLDIEC